MTEPLPGTSPAECQVSIGELGMEMLWSLVRAVCVTVILIGLSCGPVIAMAQFGLVGPGTHPGTLTLAFALVMTAVGTLTGAITCIALIGSRVRLTANDIAM